MLVLAVTEQNFLSVGMKILKKTVFANLEKQEVYFFLLTNKSRSGHLGNYFRDNVQHRMHLWLLIIKVITALVL